MIFFRLIFFFLVWLFIWSLNNLYTEFSLKNFLVDTVHFFFRCRFICSHLLSLWKLELWNDYKIWPFVKFRKYFKISGLCTNLRQMAGALRSYSTEIRQQEPIIVFVDQKNCWFFHFFHLVSPFLVNII